MGIEIRNLTFWKSGEKSWINMPSYSFVDEDGQKKWAPLIKFLDLSHHAAFEKEIKSLYHEWVVENNAL